MELIKERQARINLRANIYCILDLAFGRYYHEKKIMEVRNDILKQIDYYNEQPNWEKAFNILLDYWDSIPDEEKEKVNQKLNEVGL